MIRYVLFEVRILASYVIFIGVMLFLLCLSVVYYISYYCYIFPLFLPTFVSIIIIFLLRDFFVIKCMGYH